ncbi:hypothetical protein BOO91_02910 [Vibrio navarrensis]|nr:hypothetical protein UF06_16580 [Vibrio sp. S234-5]MBE3651333.1 hypothetical protein [Vibrio navarrensis]MBE3655245.1 hypothetical protein [Vibrio navarrensis]MBE3659899.1 hypothetical protein [Vibrio navarrensis]MBE4604006.1 hypothetical protein [Vibrio navarrensis]
MVAVVVFTMQSFTAQGGFAAGEHFSDFRDFNITKRMIGRDQVLPGFVVFKEKVKRSRLVECIDRSASGHSQ